MVRLTPNTLFALSNSKLLNKATKAALAPSLKKELDKDHCSVYCYKKNGELYLIHEPPTEDVEQCYRAWLNFGHGKDGKVKSQINFNKIVILEDWDVTYKHPYIPGQEHFNWESLICSGCGMPNQDCECCDTCGYGPDRCDCKWCQECGENIDAGNCDCTRCGDCNQLLFRDCTCQGGHHEKEEDLPSVNEGPGEGRWFA